jgi:CheY-like chemotaxis protein
MHVPIYTPGTAEPAGLREKSRPLRPADVHLLLVEDDDGDAKAIYRAFARAKISNPITRAIDGVEALEYLRGENGKPKLPRPYLMLVDMNMPRLSGIELVRTLRGDPELRDSVVFMLTTSKRDEDKLAAYDLNVAGYVVKETAGADFMSLVDLMDRYWRIVVLP